jgi:excisionase family DNA binding protein
MTDLLTLEEVATRLRVKVKTVRAWLQRGRLRGIKAGRLWRVPTDALEAFVKESTEHPMRVVKGQDE